MALVQGITEEHDALLPALVSKKRKSTAVGEMIEGQEASESRPSKRAKRKVRGQR